MKRSRPQYLAEEQSFSDDSSVDSSEEKHVSDSITEQFIDRCQADFNGDAAHVVTRNAVVSVGSLYSTMNSNRLNEISHIFLNSVKKKNLKATNQGYSGRCWMFAALNTFRHVLIKALDLENFEFSETYLFFWDKLERSNTYLLWFIDHPEEVPGTRAFEYMITDHLCDGGWWNTFANLVEKYGVVPKSAMQETFQSDDSGDMNAVIKLHLDSAINHIRKVRRRSTREELLAIKDETMQTVYNVLVKFLGEPPTSFTWQFANDDGDANAIAEMTPHSFLNVITPGLNIRDFVPMSSVPTRDLKMNENYTIRWTNNVHEGECCTLLNMNINELAKYAIKSISSGFAVWFVADVGKHFNPIHSTLDDQLDDSELVFGRPRKFRKGERITYRNVQGNHAMALTGFNLDADGTPISWQVENSWGFWDNETPGQDGFLFMSHSWFKKYVMEIVVHREFLSRTVKKHLAKTPTVLDPWDSMAPATKAGCVDAPKGYMDMLGRRGVRR